MSDTNGTNPVAKDMANLQAAGAAARQVADHAREVGTQALGQAQDLAHEAQDIGGSLASAVSERAQTLAQEAKATLAEQLQDVAKAVHRAGTQLEGHQDWMARLVEKGAAELSMLATTLRTNDMRELMGSIDGIARRQPAMFTGASLAAGFALARVGRVAVAGASKADLPSMPELKHAGPEQ